MLKDPQSISNNEEKVSLESQIIGKIIRRDDGKEIGIQMLISPHPSESGLDSHLEDINCELVAFFPGKFSEVDIEYFELKRRYGFSLYIKGKFKFDIDKEYYGRIIAESWED